MKDLHVNWDEYHALIEQLALAVFQSGYSFDTVLCLARGGLRVGDVISRVYDKPLAILAASSYRDAAGTVRGRLDIAEYITATGGDIKGRLLLVDDLVDSGTTLTRVVAHLRQRFAALAEIRTAVLWVKAGATFRPDYCVDFLADSPWRWGAQSPSGALSPAAARNVALRRTISMSAVGTSNHPAAPACVFEWCLREDSNLHALRR